MNSLPAACRVRGLPGISPPALSVIRRSSEQNRRFSSQALPSSKIMHGPVLGVGHSFCSCSLSLPRERSEPVWEAGSESLALSRGPGSRLLDSHALASPLAVAVPRASRGLGLQVRAVCWFAPVLSFFKSPPRAAL